MDSHVVIAGLAYGDEGKGGITDHLCSSFAPEPARAVVRFNGGSQCGHNVVMADGRHHCFSQFGSGTLQGARTHLSRFMMIDPLTLLAEADHLTAIGVPDPFALLTIDPGALLITPWHVAANRVREAARTARHGSCGLGIGETAAYALARPEAALRFGDLLLDWRVLRDKIAALAVYLRADLGQDLVPAAASARLARLPVREIAARVTAADSGMLPGLLAAAPVVFEGAQGILLDEQHGFIPHVTWSDTTFANAETLLAECGATATRLGVVRTYMTRHGTGPFPTEDPGLYLPEPHNVTGPWQGRVRQGHFDAVALRYALDAAGGADAIAVTHADTAARRGLRMCRSWQDPRGGRHTRLRPGPGATALARRCQPVYGSVPVPGSWPEMIGQALNTPVTIVSSGPGAGAKREFSRLAVS